MIQGEDKERNVKLLESEISELIELLGREPHDIFVVLNYQKIINKLKGGTHGKKINRRTKK